MSTNIYTIIGEIALFALTLNAAAAVRYVDANGTNAAAPYSNWITAATNIQDAVDAASAGDEIVVTNGLYATGGRSLDGLTTNRLAVDKALALRSVNGPQFTAIDGGGSNRCVLLASGASISGFTLTNGAAQFGGGVWCGSTDALLSNCVVSGNWAWRSAFVPRNHLLVEVSAYGGGAYGGTLNNCTLKGNHAFTRISGDGPVVAYAFGGGAYGSVINNCTLTGNEAYAQLSSRNAHAVVHGGGAYRCALKNCSLTDNSSDGAANCVLNNCTVTGNSSVGVSSCVLNNCTVTGHSFAGVLDCVLTNCIAYFNSEYNYDSSSTLNYSCTAPLPTNGVGNISSDPLFAVTNGWSNLRLQPNSPCINAGNNAFAPPGPDLDGNPRIAGGTVDIGAYEFQFRTYYVDANSTNAMPPYLTWATAATNIQDAVDAASAGDEIVVTNGVYATGGRSLDGLTTNRLAVGKPLALRSVNGPQFTTIDGGGSNRCVYLASGVIISGFTLTNGRAHSGGGLFCESTNAVVSNCVVAGNSSFVQYEFGSLQPGWCCEDRSIHYACAGGVYGGTLNGCILKNNWAEASTYYDHCCDIINCAPLSGCIFAYPLPGLGGGARNAILNNCTLAGNSADYGGGAYACTLNNCILYFNTAPTGTNYDSSTINYSCTAPLPTNGVSNIASDPMFVETNGWANLRLQSNSPCINAGNNAYVVRSTDLDGNPRILGGAVDIGAYEFQLLSLINFSVVPSQARFDITGQSNQVVIVETSTNLVNWSPLGTNRLGPHPFPFSDSLPASLPRRFYRAQLQ